jgi:hypothetical protein
MSERRAHRGPQPRTDRQILQHADDMALLGMVAAGRVTRAGTHLNAPYLVDSDPLWTDLKRLAREDLLFAPISGPPTLRPRGVRLLAVAWGELPMPPAD